VPDTKGKARIVICEDEVLIAKDLESRLKKLGYTICGKATSGEKAIELVEQHQPDLVMMDIVIQGDMDGIDAAEIIRDKWGIPIVFLTAYADTDRLERAKLTYPFGYILKPFQDRDLKITVEMALYVAKVDAERRRNEAKLNESEKRFQTILENIPGSVFAHDVVIFDFIDDTRFGRDDVTMSSR
jgi:AmiR/NasT family two-component response regulator